MFAAPSKPESSGDEGSGLAVGEGLLADSPGVQQTVAAKEAAGSAEGQQSAEDSVDGSLDDTLPSEGEAGE